MDLRHLIARYSQSGPRYTSYPTAPQWSEQTNAEVYRRHLQSTDLAARGPLGLYVHVPFCESLCYYCGCNIKITGDHSRSAAYVDSLRQELRNVAGLMKEPPTLAQISWGGGTPTFLTCGELEALYTEIKDQFAIDADAEVSIEVDPRKTQYEQLELLARMGFNRVSFGVQDFHPDVQKAINRIQSVEMTAGMLEHCRKLGFKGINLDLMYGLPHQTLQTFEDTVDQVIRIRPDRIALYNYAHLPSMIAHQKILDKYPMPVAGDRVEIFLLAFEKLTAAGYKAIGMDHFAVEEDELARAISDGRLYRNFMGYTVKRGAGYLGVGASAIGEIADAFFQNVREVKEYESRVASTGLATFRGCTFSDDDRKRKWIIQQLMCQFRLSFDEYQSTFREDFERAFAGELSSSLTPFFEDGILSRESGALRVSDLGRLFIRNVAMVFDAYLKAPQKVRYSQTV